MDIFRQVKIYDGGIVNNKDKLWKNTFEDIKVIFFEELYLIGGLRNDRNFKCLDYFYTFK